jgi:hypothetical protein
MLAHCFGTIGLWNIDKTDRAFGIKRRVVKQPNIPLVLVVPAGTIATGVMCIIHGDIYQL